jgi:hypothetical protein
MQMPALSECVRFTCVIAQRSENPHGTVERRRCVAKPPSRASGEGNRAKDISLGLCDSNTAASQQRLLEDRHGDSVVLSDGVSERANREERCRVAWRPSEPDERTL